MNRLLELGKQLLEVREKRKSNRKRRSAVLATTTSLRRDLRRGLSHGMDVFKSLGLDDGNAWLEVKPDSGATFSISRYTRVKDVTRKGGREYFTIVDWPYEGKKASVKVQGDASRFKNVSYEDKLGTVTYNIAKKELTFGSNSTPVKTFMSDPLPKGKYKLLLPDHPHAGGNNYTKLSPYATVWFKIEQSADDLSRYLHVGRATAGCVTCGEERNGGGTDDDRKRWTEIYHYLINRRAKGKAKYVGELVVE